MGGCGFFIGTESRDLSSERGQMRPIGGFNSRKLEVEVIRCQVCQDRWRRTMPRFAFNPNQLCPHHFANLRVARPKAQFVVEPPRSGSEALVVAFAELVRLEGERAAIEEVPHHGHGPRNDRGRVPTSKCIEGVESEVDASPERI